jgi:hypothetical protein
MISTIRLWGALALFTCAPAIALPAPLGQPVNTLQDIGPALWACWHAPDDSQNFTVTVRLSFKNNGEVLGRPRITFSSFNGSIDDQKRIMGLIVEALNACTPLNLTPSLGSAIAGRIFTMTFAPRSYKS